MKEQNPEATGGGLAASIRKGTSGQDFVRGEGGTARDREVTEREKKLMRERLGERQCVGVGER